MAAGDERILESLAPAALAGLDVVHLKVRREVDLGRFQQRDVALAADGNLERCCIVGAERVAGEGGSHAECAHAASERGGSPGGNLAHLNLDGGSGNPFAYGAVFVLEKAVEDAAGVAVLVAHVHKAHQFCRIDDYLSCLLWNEGPGTQYGGIVDLVAYALAVEFDIGGSLNFLAPESVESGEAGVFEAAYVDPVEELESCTDGLAYHGFGLA